MIRIVPPRGWKYGAQLHVQGHTPIQERMFETKLQTIENITKCQPFGNGRKYNVVTFSEMATKFVHEYVAHAHD